MNCGEPNIFVPNAFTPNNDGNNDILKVRGRWISKLQFVVYNRWGQEMFTTTDVNNGWNGVFKGNEVAPDVYNYFLQVTCLDNKIFTKKDEIITDLEKDVAKLTKKIRPTIKVSGVLCSHFFYKTLDKIRTDETYEIIYVPCVLYVL